MQAVNWFGYDHFNEEQLDYKLKMNINNFLTRRKRFEDICWILSVVLIILSLNKYDICICDYSKTINLPV